MGKKTGRSKDVVTDPRFASAVANPKFSKSKKSASTAIVLDERFEKVLTDERFTLAPGSGGATDKYGRKIKKKEKVKEGREEMEAFYKLEEKDKEEPATAGLQEELAEDNSDDSASDSSDDEKVDAKIDKMSAKDRIAYLNALSRGEISASESDDESDEDDDGAAFDASSDDDDAAEDDDEEEVVPGVLSEQLQAPTIENCLTTHMVFMNFDWSHVTAVDIFVIISSFAPPGSLTSVQVFPSDFGIKRMEEDKTLGPRGLWKEENDGSGAEEQEASDEGSESDSEDDMNMLKFEDVGEVEEGFDAEKLRRYEADKLKYYFALASFTSAAAADAAYSEIDEMEMEASSCAIDVRAVPEDEVEAIYEGRTARDIATSIPSDYEPPEFITKALQQSNVECTWEAGDDSRAKKFQAWGVGDNAWKAMEEGDDLNAYLASDCSSSEDEDNAKSSKIKSLLGLGGDDDDDDNDNSDDDDKSDDDESVDGNMEFTLKPGANDLAAKLQKKRDNKDKGELTPFEKYQQKRKEKRKERKAKLRGDKKKDQDEESADDDSVPDWAKDEYDEDGGFFLEDEPKKGKKDKKSRKGKKEEEEQEKGGSDDPKNRPATKAELEAILGSDLSEEKIKDYDMRGLQRIDKNSKKNLKGARAKKEEKRAANVSGQDFKVDTKDNRFAKLLDGGDARFGIDRTNPAFKETQAMRDILDEQGKRRDKKRKGGAAKEAVARNVVAKTGEAGSMAGGAAALAGLVSSLKAKATAKVNK
jgi:hypothetical protein